MLLSSTSAKSSSPSSVSDGSSSGSRGVFIGGGYARYQGVILVRAMAEKVCQDARERTREFREEKESVKKVWKV